MKILQHLPLLSNSRPIRFGQRHVSFHRNALVIWLIVGLSSDKRGEYLSPAFPALLDSGNNSEFFLHEHHLLHWAGMHPNQFETTGSVNINGQRISLLEADVWIHPNLPGSHERDPLRSPFRLELDDGLAIAPRGSPEF